MWICPKCGREFARQNQDHYCGKAPATVEEYIREQAHPQELLKLLEIIREAVPGCTEEIKWSMPSFRTAHSSLQMAACKNWISLYVGADVIEAFQDELNGMKYKKDALYLPYDKPMPHDLLRRMIAWCMLGKAESE